MTDRWISLLAEFRHWRSSIPTGLLLLFGFVSTLVIKWPALSDPEHWLVTELWPIVSALGQPAWLVLALLVATLIGSWWCGVSAATLIFATRHLVSHAPLDKRPQEWARLTQAVQAIVFPRRAMEVLRNRMAETAEFHDLASPDRRGAYRFFLREAVDPRRSSSLTDEPNPEVTRTWTDLRLSCGLLLPLPVFLWAFPRAVKIDLEGFEALATGLAALAIVALSAETIVRIRRIVELAVLTQGTPDALARCARAAVDSSRTAAESLAAEERTS